jgi:hypothetical protein
MCEHHSIHLQVTMLAAIGGSTVHISSSKRRSQSREYPVAQLTAVVFAHLDLLLK